MLDPDRDTRPPATGGGRSFPRAVFLISFALLLSDFTSRHVLVPAFPVLQHDWDLSDAQLGALSGVVAFSVGVLAVPLSLLGDRIGRVRAVQLMAVVWSTAALACAVAADYGQLLAARVVLGVGEAAYGSVGLAIVLAVSSPDRRAWLTGAFLAGASFGAVLGVAAGGVLTARLGWRWSVALTGVLGLLLVAVHRLVVTESRIARHRTPPAPDDEDGGADVPRARLAAVVSRRAVVCVYLAAGLQLFPAGALITWLPTYLARGYGLPTAHAALLAAAVILVLCLGTVSCGWATDRRSRGRPDRRWTTPVGQSAASLLFLGTAFAVRPSAAQLVLLALGAFFVVGPAGAAGSLVASLTPESVRATALGTLAMANNLLGLAAGPFVVGLLADRLGLDGAMRLAPLVSVAAMALLLIGRRLDARPPSRDPAAG